MQPLVSMVLPIYNIEDDWLRTCLESLRCQTHANIEVLLIDDGSVNDVHDVCDEFMQEDRRFKYVRQENQGVSAARNNGLSLAKGEFVCFVDPDDWVDSRYVEGLVDSIMRQGSDIAVCDCLVSDGNSLLPNKFLPESHGTLLVAEAKNRLLYQLVGKGVCKYYPPEIAAGVPWGKIFRTSFIKDNALAFVPGMVRMQDNIFCLYAIQLARSISYLPEPLYYYRRETSSVSHRYNPRIVGQFEFYFDRTRQFLDTYGREQILYRALDMKTLTSFNSYLTYYYFNEGLEMRWEERRSAVLSLLRVHRYQNALCNVDWDILLPQEKAFVFALKHSMIRLLWIIVKLREMGRR